MNKKINLFWMKNPQPGNMGDILSPFLLKELGYKINPVVRNSPNKFVAIGSIATSIKSGDTVWGTGIMNRSDMPKKNATYLAVRGPLTGEKVDCGVYGDPALLSSKFWKFDDLDKIEGVGHIPHYVDYNDFDLENKINILNQNPINVIREMNRYDEIISSSLHGIILAHSYGIPAGWWRASNKLSGDDSKFEDYALSVGIDLTPSTNPKNVKMTLPSKERIEEIQINLLKVLEKWTTK
jgi:hypothetical protein